MRQINIKYDGCCNRCEAALVRGSPAVYEKSMGIFCVGHAPIEVEDIRHYRQIKADAKADKYVLWAAKRRSEAERVFDHNSHYTGDIAFNTQPGHIPLRARVIARNKRADENLRVARDM